MTDPTPGEVGLREDHVVTLHDRISGLTWSCTCRATGGGAEQRVRATAREHARTHFAARTADLRAEHAAEVEGLIRQRNDLLVKLVAAEAREAELRATMDEHRAACTLPVPTAALTAPPTT